MNANNNKIYLNFYFCGQLLFNFTSRRQRELNFKPITELDFKRGKLFLNQMIGLTLMVHLTPLLWSIYPNLRKIDREKFLFYKKTYL